MPVVQDLGCEATYGRPCAGVPNGREVRVMSRMAWVMIYLYGARGFSLTEIEG
jgi:hypothetical protein